MPVYFFVLHVFRLFILRLFCRRTCHIHVVSRYADYDDAMSLMAFLSRLALLLF